MKFNIPNKLENFDFIINNPFCIFEKKNFIDHNVYNELSLNFPDEKLFTDKHKNGKKIYLNNKQENFYKFINKNIWGDFYNKFNDKKFLFSLIDLIKPKLSLIENRKDFDKFYITKKYSDNFSKKLIKKLFKYFNYKSIRLGFEFSIIKQNCFIPPHCDTENKLLSLMIYFPTKNNSVFENLGTNFYKIKNKTDINMDNWKSKYLDEKNTQLFYRNYELFYKSKFEQNKLVGFIKNEKSWHDVTKFEDNLSRKSLNINLYLE